MENIIKNFDVFKEFNAGKIGRQIFELQKSAFDNTYNAIIELQNQAGDMTARLLSDNNLLPDEGQKMLEAWRHSFQLNQLEFKKTVDDGFSQLVSFLAPDPSETETTPKAAE